MLRYVESWPGLSRFGVVCVVDAELIRERAADKFVGRVVARQIAAADLLVLNKADLVDAASMEAVVDWLARMAPQACIVKSSWGQVDPSLLLDSAPPNLNSLDIATADAQPIPFFTATIPMRAHVDLDDLAGALANAPRSVHRIKGFVTDKATGRSMLVQCVGGRCSIEPCPDAIIRPPAALVAIGIDRDDLEAIRTQLAAVAARHKTTLNETSRAGTGRPGSGVAADLGDH